MDNVLPAIFPFWVTGACTAAGGAWNASVVAEVAVWGQTTLKAEGLGAFISEVTEQGNTPLIIRSFQTFALYPWLTVEQNVAVGLMAKRLSRPEKQVAVDKMIELIGLSHYHRSHLANSPAGAPADGPARAGFRTDNVVSQEAFRASTFHPETLRHEIIALWQKQVANLKSIFMVTHNIEEAVGRWPRAFASCFRVPDDWVSP